jgi:23S rRNA (pseudouridine1915-N3)-methyltransferase
VPAKATLVALDRTGQVLSSEAFAEQIARWRDGGVRELVFVIGGPDGLDPPCWRGRSVSFPSVR